MGFFTSELLKLDTKTETSLRRIKLNIITDDWPERQKQVYEKTLDEELNKESAATILRSHHQTDTSVLGFFFLLEQDYVLSWATEALAELSWRETWEKSIVLFSQFPSSLHLTQTGFDNSSRNSRILTYTFQEGKKVSSCGVCLISAELKALFINV